MSYRSDGTRKPPREIPCCPRDGRFLDEDLYCHECGVNYDEDDCYWVEPHDVKYANHERV